MTRCVFGKRRINGQEIIVAPLPLFEAVYVNYVVRKSM